LKAVAFTIKRNWFQFCFYNIRHACIAYWQDTCIYVPLSRHCERMWRHHMTSLTVTHCVCVTVDEVAADHVISLSMSSVAIATTSVAYLTVMLLLVIW